MSTNSITYELNKEYEKVTLERKHKQTGEKILFENMTGLFKEQGGKGKFRHTHVFQRFWNPGNEFPSTEYTLENTRYSWKVVSLE
jgi:hypothetical protein